ncbi:2-C-methyl-D-erythritol 4-phosphate cytidylyltransferase [Cytobacillus gottheilii]|uniref:2-C-methyl-D-erythritol 4-phosphate cytidylyltransferase n=2 Tax=Bacillaceae TaxID=186817 RepID=A0A7V7UTJ6_9BACI|nr:MULTISPECIES: 2-C-methyl-D-erythritol 4-phosphate cytidylyltransferase [Bacillaceae]KAB2329677.1 2-C-methyl-D-erythritol 4-phosphate cytidylyltransferase [Bacillus mesophilum]QVY61681.1 2-C-methyl-D-erythritol 4-phosphate cytidylyltransferase [Cytobacillus gottheilii]
MGYEVIIPAAGQGKRMEAGKNKLLLELREVPVLIHTLKVFEQDRNCKAVHLAIHPDDEQEMKKLLRKYGIKKVASLIYGGKERQHSVYHVVKELNGEGIVLVHDAARPFVEIDAISRLVEAAEETGASILAVPMKDTVKKANEGLVSETVERASLWSVQTPQAFRLPMLLDAHERAARESYVGTDDASLVERTNGNIKIVEGSYDNIKLTTPEDLYFAEAIMNKRMQGKKKGK